MVNKHILALDSTFVLSLALVRAPFSFVRSVCACSACSCITWFLKRIIPQ